MAPVVPTSSTPFMMGIKEISDWTIPQQMKLRFSQHFNQLDRNRVGVLTGVQARGIFYHYYTLRMRKKLGNVVTFINILLKSLTKRGCILSMYFIHAF